MSDEAPDLAAALEEARQRREQEAAELAAERAAKEADFLARLRRLRGGRTFRPGDEPGPKCPTCGRGYVYDDSLRIVHPAGDCVPRSNTEAAREKLIDAVRYTFDPSEDD